MPNPQGKPEDSGKQRRWAEGHLPIPRHCNVGSTLQVAWNVAGLFRLCSLCLILWTWLCISALKTTKAIQISAFTSSSHRRPDNLGNLKRKQKNSAQCCQQPIADARTQQQQQKKTTVFTNTLLISGCTFFACG